MFVKTNMVILITCIYESIMVLAASLQVATLLSALPLENTVKIYRICLLFSSSSRSG
jgi:hypothetical protein